MSNSVKSASLALRNVVLRIYPFIYPFYLTFTIQSLPRSFAHGNLPSADLLIPLQPLWMAPALNVLNIRGFIDPYLDWMSTLREWRVKKASLRRRHSFFTSSPEKQKARKRLKSPAPFRAFHWRRKAMLRSAGAQLGAMNHAKFWCPFGVDRKRKLRWPWTSAFKEAAFFLALRAASVQGLSVDDYYSRLNDP